MFCLCLYIHMHVSSDGGQKVVPDPLQPELQIVVSPLTPKQATENQTPVLCKSSKHS